MPGGQTAPEWVINCSIIGAPGNLPANRPNGYVYGQTITSEEIKSWDPDRGQETLDRLVALGAIRKPQEGDLELIASVRQDTIAELERQYPGLAEARRGSTSDRQPGDIEDTGLEDTIAHMAELQERQAEKTADEASKAKVPEGSSSERPTQKEVKFGDRPKDK